MVWGTYWLKFMSCSKSSSVKKKKKSTAGELKGDYLNPQCSGSQVAFQGWPKSCFTWVSVSVFSWVYWAWNHPMALWSERDDQVPETRVKKYLLRSMYTKERSHGQSAGRSRGLAYREYPACIGLKSKFCRMPSNLPTCYARAGRAFLSSFSKVKSVNK